MRENRSLKPVEVACRILLTVGGLSVVGCAGAGPGDTRSRSEGRPSASGDAPPLSSVTEETSANPLAGCLQCHVDVEDEHLGGQHHGAKVTCVDCHGASKGHVADENNEVKPDEVFARENVDRLCAGCHECSRDLPVGWSKLPADSRQVCIDCHPAHRFPVTK